MAIIVAMHLHSSVRSWLETEYDQSPPSIIEVGVMRN
jgi:hypothetical protein